MEAYNHYAYLPEIQRICHSLLFNLPTKLKYSVLAMKWMCLNYNYNLYIVQELGKLIATGIIFCWPWMIAQEEEVLKAHVEMMNLEVVFLGA